MFKKTMLLAIAAAAIAAFAVPASASASTWTHNGVHLANGTHLTEEYEGYLKFSTPTVGSFECEVTVVLTAKGGTTGTITEFAPTTDTCIGAGAFLGGVLTADKSNIAVGWNVDISGTPTVTATAPNKLTIHNEYHGTAAGIKTSHLEFPSITLTTTEVGSSITAISISGTATNGVTQASGTVHAETGGTLGTTG